MLEEIRALDLREGVPPSGKAIQSHAYTSSYLDKTDTAWIISQLPSTCYVPCVYRYPAPDMHLSTAPKGRDRYYLHFVGEKTGAQRGFAPSHTAGRCQGPGETLDSRHS